VSSTQDQVAERSGPAVHVPRQIKCALDPCSIPNLGKIFRP